MADQFIRTELLFGKEGINRLANSHVAVFGVGGVGGYVCEALARSGVGKLDLIDNDRINLTNLNRQIIALHSTIGKYKTEVMRDRIMDINPAAVVKTYETFFLPENADTFDFDQYDYVVDAIDTVTAKLELIMQCQTHNVPIICSMGTGCKMDPTGFKVTDIYKTKNDPLARVMRRELKDRGVKKCKVVYSEELAIAPDPEAMQRCIEDGKGTGDVPCPSRRSIPGSNAFVPPAAGLTIASAVIKDLLKDLLKVSAHHNL